MPTSSDFHELGLEVVMIHRQRPAGRGGHRPVNLAGEIRKGMTQKAKMDGWPTKAPIGYLNVREKSAGKEIAKVTLDPLRGCFEQQEVDLARATMRSSLAGRDGR